MKNHYDLVLTLATPSPDELMTLADQIEQWCDLAMDEENCDCRIEPSTLAMLKAGEIPTLEGEVKNRLDGLKEVERILLKHGKSSRLFPSRDHLEEQAEAVIADSRAPEGVIHLTVVGGEDSSVRDCVQRLITTFSPGMFSDISISPALPMDIEGESE